MSLSIHNKPPPLTSQGTVGTSGVGIPLIKGPKLVTPLTSSGVSATAASPAVQQNPFEPMTSLLERHGVPATRDASALHGIIDVATILGPNTGTLAAPADGIAAFFAPNETAPTAGTLALPAALEPYRPVLEFGIQSEADYRLAVDLITALPGIVDPAQAPLANDIVEVITKFEAARTAAPGAASRLTLSFGTHYGRQTSYTRRTVSQQFDRKTTYAAEVFLEHKATVYWLIHEALHALPTDDVPARFQAVEIPIGPKSVKDLNLVHIYKTLVGSYVRDEARAVLGETILYQLLTALGAPTDIARRATYVKDAAQRYTKSLNEYLDSDVYLGDNHFVMYQLRGLFQVAEAIQNDPSRLDELYVSDSLFHTGITNKLGGRFEFGEVNFLRLYNQFRTWLETEPVPGDPLVPIRHRVLRYLGRAAPVTKARRATVDGIKYDLSLGDRPTPPPGGDPQRLVDFPDVSRDRVVLIGVYADFLNRLFETSAVEVKANLRAYLRYAERCNQEIAGVIYARLLLLLHEEAGGVPVLEGIELAHSLLRAGYMERGQELLAAALTSNGTIERWDTDWNEILLDFHRAGRHLEVARILDKVEAGRAKLHTSYTNAVLQAFDRQVWWRRGGRQSLTALIIHHPYGIPDAMLYDAVRVLQKHRGRRKSYFRYQGVEEHILISS